MNRWLYILLHVATAAVFGFVLQRYALQQSVDTSMLWAAAFGVGAAFVSWRQTGQ